MRPPTALITGITGQDGSYLAEFLLAKGYVVHGLCQPGSDGSLLSSIVHRISLHEANLEDAAAVSNIVRECSPDECYHLAAQTFVAIDAGQEADMLDTNVAGVHRLLTAMRIHKPDGKFFLASSAEMFGAVDRFPQDETTPICPRSFYGVTKAAAYHLVRFYRETHGLKANCGILYNHESPRRGTNFVTRKIARAAAQIRIGHERELRLGNLDSVRDWGHARDYVRAMWLMMRRDDPDDYIVATGQGRTVRDFVEAAFTVAGLEWQQYVIVDPKFYRPLEPCPLVGNAAKARKQLGWTPDFSFAFIVHEMVESELRSCDYPDK